MQLPDEKEDEKGQVSYPDPIPYEIGDRALGVDIEGEKTHLDLL